jgi:hypothetical protein
MADPDGLGKVKRRNVRRGKPHQGEESVRIEWRDLGRALRCSSYRTLGQETAQRQVAQRDPERMKWERPRGGPDDW